MVSGFKNTIDNYYFFIKVLERNKSIYYLKPISFKGYLHRCVISKECCMFGVNRNFLPVAYTFWGFKFKACAFRALKVPL